MKQLLTTAVLLMGLVTLGAVAIPATEEGAAAAGPTLSRPVPMAPEAARKIDPNLLFAISMPNKTTRSLEPIARRISILGESPEALVFPCMIRTSLSDAELAALGARPESRVGEFVTARIAQEDLARVAADPAVLGIEAAYRLEPTLDVSVPEIRAHLVNQGAPSGYSGAGVIYGMLDDGIDITHDDFKNAGGSRILSIWDHYRDGNPPSGYSYGYEYTKAAIDAGQASQFVNEGGHGSHVAGIAVGDGSSLPTLKYRGVAWQADIIHVRNGGCDLFCYGGGSPWWGSQTTVGSIDGLNYMINKANALGKPLVVNQSQGVTMGPHDGTTYFEQAYDNLVANNGLIICIAAGNDQDADWHGKATASGNQVQFTLNHDNSMGGDAFLQWELWYKTGDQFRWELVNPGGGTIQIDANSPPNQWQGSVFTAGQQDTCFYWAQTSHPVNGQGYAAMWLQNRRLGTAFGTWTVRGIAVNALPAGGVVDLYCERNQPALKVVGGLNTDAIVGMPGTASGAITVASYNTKLEWDAIDGNHYTVQGENPVGDISSFSSWGPRRDGALKPDIAAPGSWVMATWANGNQAGQPQIDPGGKHKIISGTSMAAPHVSGVIALMLEKDPSLAPSTVKNLLTSTARTDGYTGAVWNKKWGYGKLDAQAAVDAVSGGGPGGCPTTPGDANQDSAVNILDIVAVVNHILGIAQLDANGQACADTNQDQAINILDVVEIVNIILGKTAPALALALGEEAAPLDWGQGLDEGSFHLALDGSRVAGLEMMVRLPRGYELAGDPVLGGAAAGATLASSERLGQRVLLAYNPGGGPLGSGEAPLVVHVPLRHVWNGGDTVDRFAVTRLLLSDLEGRTLPLAADPILDTTWLGLRGGVRSQASFRAISPNPARDISSVSYDLPRSATVRVTVYDPAGRKVRTLWDGWQMAGGHSLPWDGTNDAGEDLGAGIYFVRLEGEGFDESRKVTVVR